MLFFFLGFLLALRPEVLFFSRAFARSAPKNAVFSWVFARSSPKSAVFAAPKNAVFFQGLEAALLASSAGSQDLRKNGNSCDSSRGRFSY